MLLAFDNVSADGVFAGTLSNPMPVRGEGDALVVDATASGAAEQRSAAGLTTVIRSNSWADRSFAAGS